MTSRTISIALWTNAALLAVIAVALATQQRLPSFLPAAMAQNQPTIGGGAGVFIVPAQFAEKSFGCYLMDIDAQTLCAYEFFPGDKQLRLVAARNFRFDRRLGRFNTDNPTPDDVKQLVDQEAQSHRTQEPSDKPSPEAPKPE